MKKYCKKIMSIVLIITGILSISVYSYSHSGRTDSNGGHKDKNNKSGLGGYHYHCGGYPAHLHPNGVCPYSSSSSSKETSTSTSTTTSIKTNEKVNELKVEDNKTVINTEYSNNTATNNIIGNTNSGSNASNDSDAAKGAIALGVLGGGGYLIYKKQKKTKKS